MYINISTYICRYTYIEEDDVGGEKVDVPEIDTGTVYKRLPLKSRKGRLPCLITALMRPFSHPDLYYIYIYMYVYVWMYIGHHQTEQTFTNIYIINIMYRVACMHRTPTR